MRDEIAGIATYIWMNLIMTSRRDVSGLIIWIGKIINGRMITAISGLVNDGLHGFK